MFLVFQLVIMANGYYRLKQIKLSQVILIKQYLISYLFNPISYVPHFELCFSPAVDEEWLRHDVIWWYPLTG